MEPLILVPNSYRESIGQNKRNAQWENSRVISLNSTTKRKVMYSSLPSCFTYVPISTSTGKVATSEYFN